MTPSDFKAGRNQLGLTQAQCAKVMAVTPQTIRKWETDAGNSTARSVNPTAAQVMRWMLAGFRPPEFPQG